MRKNVRRISGRAGKKRAVLTTAAAALTAAVMSFCALLTACTLPGEHPELTADPSGSESSTVTAAPYETGAPLPTGAETVTRGPELPVSPLPETPEDPFDPAAYPPLSSETQAKIQKLLNYYGTSFASIYNAINNRDARRPYFYYDYDDALNSLPGYDELARHILDEGHGVCYHFAALTYYMLRAAGYNACIIHGYREIDMALHYWTMVETEYGWYHFDPLHRQMLLTDAQKSSDFFTDGNGLTWQAGIWPRSATRPYPG